MRRTGELHLSVRGNSQLSGLLIEIGDAKVYQRFDIKARLKEQKQNYPVHGAGCIEQLSLILTAKFIYTLHWRPILGKNIKRSCLCIP